jgi:3-oxoacyl-[acyl-carrier-protein] synthase III
VRKFAETSRALLERNGLSPEQLDLFVAHQANLRIIDAARDRLGLPDAKVVKNIHEYGNTTAATIPLALGTALDEGRLRRGDLVLLASVGAGFTVGTVLLRWSGFEWKRS